MVLKSRRVMAMANAMGQGVGLGRLGNINDRTKIQGGVELHGKRVVLEFGYR
jgi:hypothetical protein